MTNVTIDHHVPIAVLTLNDPMRLNPLGSGVLRSLEENLTMLAKRADVSAVVVTGSGRAFSAGGDIAEYQSFNENDFDRFHNQTRHVFGMVEAFPKLTIAAVNGLALGGGFELVLCCDIVLATPEAEFGLPEGTLGLVPGGGGTQRLLRAVGHHRAAEVLMTCRRLSSEEAFGLGLVNGVVPTDELLATAMAMGRDARKVAPLATLEMKQLLLAGAGLPLELALDLEQDAFGRLLRSADAAEAIQAFNEKREATFRGQ